MGMQVVCASGFRFAITVVLQSRQFLSAACMLSLVLSNVRLGIEKLLLNA